MTDAQRRLAGATMTAPFAGDVASVNLTIGQQVSGSQQLLRELVQRRVRGVGLRAAAASAAPSAVAAVSSTTSSQLVHRPDRRSSTRCTSPCRRPSTTPRSPRSSPDCRRSITPNGSTTPVVRHGQLGRDDRVVDLRGHHATRSRSTSPDRSRRCTTGASATVSIVVKQLTDVLAVPTTALHYTGSTPKVTRRRRSAARSSTP